MGFKHISLLRAARKEEWRRDSSRRGSEYYLRAGGAGVKAKAAGDSWRKQEREREGATVSSVKLLMGVYEGSESC